MPRKGSINTTGICWCWQYWIQMNEWMNEWNTYISQYYITWLRYINLQLCWIFLFCKKAAVGLLLTAKKLTKSNNFLLQCVAWSWENTKLKWKTCRTNDKMCLKWYLKLALYKTARAHKKSLQKTLVLFHWNRVLTVRGKLWCNASNQIRG